MLAAGVSPMAVAGHLGDTLETLQRVYAYWMRDDRSAPADAIDELLLESRGPGEDQAAPCRLEVLVRWCGGGESVCTPDSVEDGHPSRPAVARRLQRSTRELDGPPAPCLTLLQVGFTEPSGSPRTLVRSYRTVAPLPVRPANRKPSAVSSLWHCPAGRPDWVLPSTLPCGVRTFLGRVEARTRPSNRLTTAGGSSHVPRLDPVGPPAGTIPTRATRPRRRDSSAENRAGGRRVRRRRSRGSRTAGTRSSRRRHRRPRRRRSGRGCGPG